MRVKTFKIILTMALLFSMPFSYIQLVSAEDTTPTPASEMILEDTNTPVPTDSAEGTPDSIVAEEIETPSSPELSDPVVSASPIVSPTPSEDTNETYTDMINVIDTMPTVEELRILPVEEQNTLLKPIYEISDSFDAMSEEELTHCKEIITQERYDKVLDFLYQLTEQVEVTHTGVEISNSKILEQMKPFFNKTPDPWQKKLESVFYDRTTIKKENSEVTGTITWQDSGCTGDQVWNGSDGQSAPPAIKTDEVTNIKYYEVKTAAQLRYAIDKFTSNSSGTPTEIRLMNDIDLNGANYNWPGGKMNKGQTIDGNGHTIWNVCNIYSLQTLDTGGRTGFISTFNEGASVKNLNFNGGYLIGSENKESTAIRTGLFAFGGEDSSSEKPFKFTNVHAKNIIVLGNIQTGVLFGRIGSAAEIKNCSVVDSVALGSSHVGSLSAAIVGKNTDNPCFVENCYSTDVLVISFGNHSGGFISCLGHTNVKNSFTNALVYSQDQTGVFTGAANGTSSFSNCAATGFINGSPPDSNISGVGGFIGVTENSGSVISFDNCYSSALVGLDKDAYNMGGFVGLLDGRVSVTFENCYASGEVGTVNTSVSGSSNSNSIGGFVGRDDSNIATYTNCFYDKQTTAMREIGVGSFSKPNETRANIKGVLTTSTNKSGTGLTDLDISDAYDSSSVDHTPELKVFSNPTVDSGQGEWLRQEDADMAKAFSKSSTTTAILNTWEYGLDTSTGEETEELDYTVYDTVRDITADFHLTSDSTVNEWITVKTDDGTTEDHQTVNVLGKEYNIVDLIRDPNNGNLYMVQNIMPGIEWLLETSKQNDATVTRRIRVIPTVGLNPGLSQILPNTAIYDHADDVELFFSTGQRLGTSMDDITTGIYPDKESASNALIDRQNALMSNKRVAGSTLDSANTVSDSNNDKFMDASISYMGSTTTTDNASESSLFTYIYPVSGFTANDQLILGAKYDVSSIDNPISKLFNGYKSFADTKNENPTLSLKGNDIYLVTYKWQLKDGRYIENYKMIQTTSVPYSTDVNVFKNSNTKPYPDGGYIYAGNKLSSFNNYNQTSILSAHSGRDDIQYKELTTTAIKINYPEDSIQSVTLSMDYGFIEGNNQQTQTFTSEGVKEGDRWKFDVNTVFYSVVYKNGDYYTIPQYITRVYYMDYDTASDTYYIHFDKNGEFVGDELPLLYDASMNVKVDFVLNSSRPDPSPSGSTDSPGTNSVGSITCEEAIGKGWVWNNQLGVCEFNSSGYRVPNTSASY